MYKIYESDNYIIVTKVENGETFYGHKKNVFIDKNNTNKPFYSIFNVKDFKEDTVLKIGEIQKQDGTLYTEAEFDTFYRTNTGNFNGGGTAPTGDFLSNDETSYIDATLPLAGTELALVEQGGTFKKVEVSDLASNKLDKVTTNDVEKVYIKNADGTQSMKPTSEFVTTTVTGTINRISKFTAGGTIGDSQIFDNGTNVGIGTISPSTKLDLVGFDPGIRQSVERTSGGVAFSMFNLDAKNTTSGLSTSFGSIGVYGNLNVDPTPPSVGYIYMGADSTTTYNDNTFRLYPGKISNFQGNVGIGTTTPSQKLEVVGNTRITGESILGSTSGLAIIRGDNQNAGTGGAIQISSSNVATNQYIAFGSGLSGTGAFTERMRVLSTGNVGIGTTSPQARLDVRAQGVLATDIVLRVRNSTDTQNFLVVNGAGDVYNNGAKGVNTNTFFGENVGRNTTGIYNTAIGAGALRDNTTGNSNAAIGVSALGNNTIGGSNTAIGLSALQNNTTGNSNAAIGASALFSNTTGASNAAIGVSALRANTTGYSNTAIGVSALGNNTTGNSNAAIGFGAGRLISNGSNNTITNESIFIGGDTRALADNQTNQIVIGYSAIGLGSNSVVLGNTSITITQLRGQVIMGAFASPPTGIEGAIYYDSTKKKHYGFDGTNWNALY